MKTSNRSNASTRCKNNSQNSGKLALPSPVDFDYFIPWICLQFQSPQYVYISRLIREDHANKTKRTSTIKTKHKNSQGKPESINTVIDFNRTPTVCSLSNAEESTHTQGIPIKAYYNIEGDLVEIAIINFRYEISRNIIQAINLCIPFHSSLSKLTITRVKLSPSVVYEVSKLLTHSNITEVCLNDTYIPEGNYYTLLDKSNILKRLSLQRCSINDGVCKKIADTLCFEKPAAKTLLSLDLTSNKITDRGAIALGDSLRTNRRLLHLNLSDNMITDAGAIHIFNHLMPFSINSEETLNLKRKRLDYYKIKVEECKEVLENNVKVDYEDNKENIKQTKSRRMTQGTKLQRSTSKLKKSASSLAVKKPPTNPQADEATKKIVTEFDYVFDNKLIVYDNDAILSVGNLKLCNLNLAYNNLSYFTVRKIHEVIVYQNQVDMAAYRSTGLLRIILDGNDIPVCKELREIGEFLGNTIMESQTTFSIKAKKPK